VKQESGAGIPRRDGKPLGVTGEVAEYEAARILCVKLTPTGQAGYDAIVQSKCVKRHLHIEGRCLLRGSKPGQRLGRIDVAKDSDAVLVALLDVSATPIDILTGFVPKAPGSSKVDNAGTSQDAATRPNRILSKLPASERSDAPKPGEAMRTHKAMWLSASIVLGVRDVRV
jgi:hypothetical protein